MDGAGDGWREVIGHAVCLTEERHPLRMAFLFAGRAVQLPRVRRVFALARCARRAWIPDATPLASAWFGWASRNFSSFDRTSSASPRSARISRTASDLDEVTTATRVRSGQRKYARMIPNANKTKMIRRMSSSPSLDHYFGFRNTPLSFKVPNKVEGRLVFDITFHNARFALETGENASITNLSHR